MKRCTRSVLCLATLLVCVSFLKAQKAQETDTSPHTVQMIPVERDIKLEVLDSSRGECLHLDASKLTHGTNSFRCLLVAGSDRG